MEKKPKTGLIWHSDRGSQYASESHREILKDYKIKQSMSRKGDCRKRRYLGRYFAHPMMQNRRAKRDDYKPSAVRVTQRYVP